MNCFLHNDVKLNQSSEIKLFYRQYLCFLNDYASAGVLVFVFLSSSLVSRYQILDLNSRAYSSAVADLLLNGSLIFITWDVDFSGSCCEEVP